VARVSAAMPADDVDDFPQSQTRGRSEFLESPTPELLLRPGFLTLQGNVAGSCNLRARGYG
jgi:hypothetical protein